MGRIYIRDLALRCIIGVFPAERREKQDVLINIMMECDFSEAARTDLLKHAVDYKSLKTQIIAFVEKSRFQLLETLADRIANLCMEDARVHRVTVTVDKPGALRFARSVAVEVTRERPRIK
jgi:D-erythro-7,8-dihydroneopterin triphosphate epimerase